MMDSQENALNQSNLEETVAEQPVVNNEEATPAEVPAAVEAPVEEVPAEAPVEEPATEPEKRVYATKAEVVERIQELAAADEVPAKDEVELMKTLFYKYHNAERDARLKAYLDEGGDPENYVAAPDPLEDAYKTGMAVIREKRASQFQLQEEERQKNLEKKLAIIEKIKAMAISPDEANRAYQEFKALQQEWKEIGAVPATHSTELWRTYQHVVEQYYDLLKLNIEAREYDFKKNLELKLAICEAAEKLAEEKDVISAFHQLQELHNQFREIGPVARDLREEVWARFKAASTVINKAHQDHFDRLRAGETENLEKKTALCEKAEAIVAEPNNSISDWERHTKEIVALQAEWKTIGFAPQKMNVKIFERFRSVCASFFAAKTEFFRSMKSEINESIAKRQALIEKARELSDSTEWRAGAEKLTALQAEWKALGRLPHKSADRLWNEFRGYCNKFFEARNAATAETRKEEKANMAVKRDIVARLKALTEGEVEDLQEKVKALQAEYMACGRVPYRDGEKLHKEYRAICDEIYGKLRAAGRNRHMENFRQGLKAAVRRGEEAVDNERARLLREYDALKQEIQTYENNLGFLNAASKSGNALVAEIQRKVENLKSQLSLIKDQIKEIDTKTAEEKPAEE